MPKSNSRTRDAEQALATLQLVIESRAKSDRNGYHIYAAISSFCATATGGIVMLMSLGNSRIQALFNDLVFLQMPIAVAVIVVTIIVNAVAILPGVISGNVAGSGVVRKMVVLTCSTQTALSYCMLAAGILWSSVSTICRAGAAADASKMFAMLENHGFIGDFFAGVNLDAHCTMESNHDDSRYAIWLVLGSAVAAWSQVVMIVCLTRSLSERKEATKLQDDDVAQECTREEEATHDAEETPRKKTSTLSTAAGIRAEPSLTESSQCKDTFNVDSSAVLGISDKKIGQQHEVSTINSRSVDETANLEEDAPPPDHVIIDMKGATLASSGAKWTQMTQADVDLIMIEKLGKKLRSEAGRSSASTASSEHLLPRLSLSKMDDVPESIPSPSVSSTTTPRQLRIESARKQSLRQSPTETLNSTPASSRRGSRLAERECQRREREERRKALHPSRPDKPTTSREIGEVETTGRRLEIRRTPRPREESEALNDSLLSRSSKRSSEVPSATKDRDVSASRYSWPARNDVFRGESEDTGLQPHLLASVADTASGSMRQTEDACTAVNGHAKQDAEKVCAHTAELTRRRSSRDREHESDTRGTDDVQRRSRRRSQSVKSAEGKVDPDHYGEARKSTDRERKGDRPKDGEPDRDRTRRRSESLSAREERRSLKTSRDDGMDRDRTSTRRIPRSLSMHREDVNTGTGTSSRRRRSLERAEELSKAAGSTEVERSTILL